MAHDVYICYDEQDKLASDAICHVLEENNIKCWVKSRDFTSGSVDDISKAIKASKCVVLVYSKNSKNSQFVVTEIDIAFANSLSIIVYNLDDSNRKGQLEFFLKNKHWLSAFPNPTHQFESLIKDTSKILGVPIENPIVSPKVIRSFKKSKPKSKRNKIKKIALVGVGAFIIFWLMASIFITFVDNGLETTDDGVFSIKITNVTVDCIGDSFYYTVEGKMYNRPDNAKDYLMQTKCYDKNNNEVFSENATAEGFIGKSFSDPILPQKNVAHVSVTIKDYKGNVICEDSYDVT